MSVYVVILCVLFFFVGLFIILTNNPVHAILALVLVFFLSACLAIALGVEFLAILILIVYVGAISVLFLFVVMLLNIRVLELNTGLLKYWWVGVFYSAFFFLNLWYTVAEFFFLEVTSRPSFIDLSVQLGAWNSISQFGEVIFLYFPHLLILAALILFVAIVSPVTLTYIVFVKIGSSPALPHKQTIFLQTLRNSLDKNFSN